MSMVITPHALIGALSSQIVGGGRVRRALAATASHFVLDRIPHYDYDVDNRALLLADAATASLLVGIIEGDRLGAFCGVLPDLVSAAERATGTSVTLPAHAANHTPARPGLPVGVAIQVATVVAGTVAHEYLLSRRERKLWAEETRPTAPGEERGGW